MSRATLSLLLLLAGACATLHLSSAAAADGDDQGLRRELAEMHNDIQRAYNKRDASTALRRFAPDARRVENGLEYHGQHEVREGLEAEMELLRDTNFEFRYEINDFARAGGSRAWDHGTWEIRERRGSGGSDGEKGRVFQGHYIGLSRTCPETGRRVLEYLHCSTDKQGEAFRRAGRAALRYQRVTREAIQDAGACGKFAEAHAEDAVVWPPGAERPIVGREEIRRDCVENARRREQEQPERRAATVLMAADRYGDADEQGNAQYEQGRYHVVDRRGEVREQGIYVNVYRRRGGAASFRAFPSARQGEGEDFEVTATTWEPERRLERDMRRTSRHGGGVATQ